ncbi:MAG TPA: metalloregulator ArsR/SmtB family transcription factor [Gemmatimonadaceae bacterium]|nr:metalloregulator ArsR/SmtB family transcription factor [Gemmatimonadaceae bacterium]
MGNTNMTPELIGIVAGRFKALGEPARLEILNALRDGEMTVTELVDETGLGQANVSKHLQLLHSLGFVSRRKDGLFVYYGLADRDVFRLCDIMCARLVAETLARRRALAGR